MSYPITHIEGLEADEIKRSRRSASARPSGCSRRPRARRAASCWPTRPSINEKRLLRWANACDHMRIKGMGKGYVGLLREVGVDTVRELRYRKPENLASAMAEANRRKKLVRLLPSEKLVVRWIEHAKKLPLKITYKK